MCSFLCERDTVAAPYLCLLSSYSTSMLRLSSAQKITFGSDSAARRHLLAVPLPQSPGQTSESRKPTWVLLKKTKQTKMLSWYFAPPSSVGGTTCPLNLNQPKKKKQNKQTCSAQAASQNNNILHMVTRLPESPLTADTQILAFDPTGRSVVSYTLSVVVSYTPPTPQIQLARSTHSTLLSFAIISQTQSRGWIEPHALQAGGRER